MKKQSTCCSIGLLLYCAAVSLTPCAHGEASTNHSSGNRNRPTISAGTNLLYIVPKDSVGSNGWQSAWMRNEGTNSEENDAEASATTVYFIQNLNTQTNKNPFAALFGADSVIVPVDNSGNLFKLIATKIPEEPLKLPAIRLDPRHYHLIKTTTVPVWPKGSKPKSVMMKWAEWWQSETNATPVVLILVHF